MKGQGHEWNAELCALLQKSLAWPYFIAFVWSGEKLRQEAVEEGRSGCGYSSPNCGTTSWVLSDSRKKREENAMLTHHPDDFNLTWSFAHCACSVKERWRETCSKLGQTGCTLCSRMCAKRLIHTRIANEDLTSWRNRLHNWASRSASPSHNVPHQSSPI